MKQSSQGGGGLVNMGLTCYGNAVIQNMRHISKLTWILEEGKYNTLFTDGNTRDERQKVQSVTQAFAKVVQFLWKCKKGQSVKPGEFWANVARSQIHNMSILQIKLSMTPTSFASFSLKVYINR